MNKKLSLIAPAVTLAVLASLTGCAAQTAETTQADTTAPIIGEWQMTSLEVTTDGTMQEVPYSGQIIFTDAGTVSVQAMNPDTTAPDTPYTLGGYEAFYGSTDIDEADGTFTIDVESAIARDLIGQELSRNYEVTDDTLVLTPTDAAEGWRVTYERATR